MLKYHKAFSLSRNPRGFSTIAPLTKHDRYVDQLCGVLASRYPLVLRNIPLYSKKKRRVAEIDLLAVKGTYCDVYEVKCSHRLSKARKQLSKIRRVLAVQSVPGFQTPQVRHTFFYCGDSKRLFRIENQNKLGFRNF